MTLRKQNEIMGRTDLKEILKNLAPKHNLGDFVFCSIKDITKIDLRDILMIFKEEEGITIIIKKELADSKQLSYSFISSWITLDVHSSLTAVGLTAAFSKALSENGISCNVVAACYHDHIFVDKKNTHKSMEVLKNLSEMSC